MAERRLNAQRVEEAEGARKLGQVVRAAELATIGLGTIDETEIAKMANDPEQRAILACLARIQVDALKTVANQTKWPHQALPPLEQAAKTINLIYRNEELRGNLEGVERDHLGRKHHFLAEMPRDEAKTLFAAAALYNLRQADSLIERGEQVLAATYNSLPDSHPTKALIGIELQLSRAGRGIQIDGRNLLENFGRLVETDRETNLHRVATVASWLTAWGEKIGDEEVKNMGFRVFTEIVSQHPEWQFMTEHERRKIAKQQLRRLVFRMLTPVTTRAERRKALKEKLIAD